MKKIIFISTMILFVNQLFAQNQKLSMGEIQAPKIQWEQEDYDFGKIPQHKPVDIVFKFKNTGTAPMVLSKVEASCGCTNVEYKKAPIMPGQTGEIGVTFDAEEEGMFSKSVSVTANTNPSLTILKFKGEVIKQ